MKGKCEIRVSNASGGRLENYMHLSIQDERSRVVFLSVDLSYSEFGEIIAGHGKIVDVEYRDLDKIGMKAELKHEIVTVPEFGVWNLSEEQLKELVKDYEVDGWVADYDDLRNHHRSVGPTKRRVTFRRHVPAEEG